MREGEEDDLTGFRMCQKMGDSCSEGGGFAGSGRCKDTEILLRRLADNTGLFVIECEGAFAEDEPMTHSFISVGVA